MKMRNIIDTWNMVEKYGLEVLASSDREVVIADADYERLLASVKNQAYIKNLRLK